VAQAPAKSRQVAGQDGAAAVAPLHPQRPLMITSVASVVSEAGMEEIGGVVKIVIS